MNNQAFSKIWIPVIVLTLITGGFFAWQYFGTPEEKTETLEGGVEDETADWKTYRNEEYGFEMKYPEDFFPTQPLQPKTKVIQCDYANFANKCPFIPIEGFTGTEESAFRQGFAAKPTPERITINGVPFCRQENREGAMGTSYITYNYTTVREKECFVVAFAVGYPNCLNYLPIENQKMQEVYDKCRLDNEVVKPETINKMPSTFKFLQ